MSEANTMTTQTEALSIVDTMKLALEAFEGIQRYGLDTLSGRVDGPDDREWQRAGVNEMTKRARLGVTAIKEALAQPEQEPWGACLSGRVFVGKLPEHVRRLAEDNGLTIQWLYTIPPQHSAIARTTAEGEDTRSSAATLCRAWVGLTKDQMLEILREIDPETQRLPIGFRMFADAIEAKLKEKNT